MKIVGSFISKTKPTHELNTISLMIDQEVTITESYIPEFSVTTFFADLGGSLGLWLGVGAVQLLSSGVGLLKWMRTTLCKERHF